MMPSPSKYLATRITPGLHKKPSTLTITIIAHTGDFLLTAAVFRAYRWNSAVATEPKFSFLYANGFVKSSNTSGWA